MEPRDNLLTALQRTLFAPDEPPSGGTAVAEQTSPAGSDAGAEAPPSGGDTDPSTPEPSEPTPASDEGDDTVFRIDDVPEEIRPHVERLQRQFQSTLSRARNADREEFRDAEAAVALVEALNDDETALDTLQDLVQRIGGAKLVRDGEAPEPPPAATGEGDDVPEAVRDELQALREAEERRTAKDTEEARARRAKIVREHVEAGIKKYAPEGEELPEDTNDLLTFASLSNRGRDGLPDVDRAVELLRAHDARTIDAFIKSKTGEPGPDLSGVAGVSQADTTTEAGRLRAAEAVAARRLGPAS